MIESVLLEAARQIPSLLVLAWLVVQFLNGKRSSEAEFLDALSRMDDAWRENLAVRDNAIASLGDNCHQFQRDIAAHGEAVFAKVAAAMDQNTEIIGKNIHVIERLEECLDLPGGVRCRDA